ncbi:uncharacterized protein LOC144876600 [Branchiostoma floridae x Branchiostoma japonicum]
MVQQNLISASLARHLLAPICTSTPKKRKTAVSSSGARVFTEEAFILEREAIQKKKEDAEQLKQERKKLREMRAEQAASKKMKASSVKSKKNAQAQKMDGKENRKEQKKTHCKEKRKREEDATAPKSVLDGVDSGTMRPRRVRKAPSWMSDYDDPTFDEA